VSLTRSSGVVLVATLLACGSGCSSSNGNAHSGPVDAGRDSLVLIDTAMPPRDANPYAWNEAAPSCQPNSPAAFAPVKVAPVKNAVCTTAQVTGMVTQCFDPMTGTSSAACATWKAVAENQECMESCPVMSDYAKTAATTNPPPPPAGPWGPLIEVVSQSSILLLNLGGCVAAADPSAAAQSCADAMNAQLECEYYVCAANCPIPTTDDAMVAIDAEEAYQNCTLAADSGPCLGYANAANACIADLPGTTPAEFCLDASLLSGDPVTFDPAFEKLIGNQCGGKAATDAGPPDAPAD
jgi:hypothetical protein